MRNCPKCGNPLQDNATSCPVCGTNFVVANTNQVSVVQPVQVQANNTGGLVNNQQVMQHPINQTVTVQQPVMTQQQANGQIQQAVTAPVAPSNPQVQNNVSLTKDSPGVQQQNVSSVNNNVHLVKKGSVKINNKILLLIVLIVAIIIVFFVLTGGKKGSKVVNTAQTLDYVSVVSNGFRFKMDKSWFVLSGNNVVIIKDDNSSILVKLEKYDTSISDYSKANIEKYLNSRDELIDEYEVIETNIESSPAIIVKAKVLEEEKQDAEYYYIKAGEKLIVGASVIYLKDNEKSKNTELVSNLISSLSYSDDNSIALKEVNNHIKTYGIFGNILGRSNNWYDYEEDEVSENEDEETQSNDEELEEQESNEEIEENSVNTEDNYE